MMIRVQIYPLRPLTLSTLFSVLSEVWRLLCILPTAVIHLADSVTDASYQNRTASCLQNSDSHDKKNMWCYRGSDTLGSAMAHCRAVHGPAEGQHGPRPPSGD